MSEYSCSDFNVLSDLGCDNLQLFEGVIDSEVPKQSPDIRAEDAFNWKTEETFDLIYDISRTISKSLLPSNRKERMDVHTHPLEKWTSKNILDWICELYSKNNKNYEILPLPKFNKVTINEFELMQINDFLNKSVSIEDAKFIFNCKEQLFKDYKLEGRSNEELMEMICKMYDQHNRHYENIDLKIFKNVTMQKFKEMGVEDLHTLLGNWDDAKFLYDCKSDRFGCQAVYPSHCQVNNSSEVNNNKMHPFYNNRMPVVNTQMTEDNYSVNDGNMEPVKIRKRGRPRTKGLQPVKNERRTGKLWEFLRNLLMDEKTCPSLIKWENYAEGTFKFVQNEKVAKLWGERKKNGKMNYEKFSRAMRYYYRNKILQPVSGKRLVYKFGPNSTGWRDIKPIL